MLLYKIDQRANLITEEMRRIAREISRDIAEMVNQGHDLDELILEGRLHLRRSLDELCEALLV
jgi:hypothetical protein